MSHPYSSLPPEAYWRSAIADRSMFDIDRLWHPKQRIDAGEGVATYGSCFAQRFGTALSERGHSWVCTEAAPEGCPQELAHQFNYGVFSARTGNIYTTTMLDQWAAWATGEMPVPTQVWEQGGRYFDPFRPAIEPGGFSTAQDVLMSRRQAIDSFRESIRQARHFVFTMGLTEAWLDAASGLEYPVCPGTAAGVFDAAQHQFTNRGFQEVKTSLQAALKRIRSLNPTIRVILTVSPVPLTATASGQHVLVATTHSKSVLRAVAGELAADPSIDYFPSYEIITSSPFAGVFFEPNKRNVNPCGVDFVMKAFFEPMGGSPRLQAEVTNAPFRGPRRPGGLARRRRQSEVCEESLLDAFKS